MFRLFSAPTHTHTHARTHTRERLWCDSELFIISVQLITMEEYVQVCGFASSQLCSSQWRSTCQCIYVCTNCTPSGSHTSVYHLGHIRHFPGKVNGSYVDGKPIQCEQIRPAVSNKRYSPARTHLRTLSLTLSCIHKQEFSEITM